MQAEARAGSQPLSLPTERRPDFAVRSVLIMAMRLVCAAIALQPVSFRTGVPSALEELLSALMTSLEKPYPGLKVLQKDH